MQNKLTTVHNFTISDMSWGFPSEYLIECECGKDLPIIISKEYAQMPLKEPHNSFIKKYGVETYYACGDKIIGDLTTAKAIALHHAVTPYKTIQELEAEREQFKKQLTAIFQQLITTPSFNLKDDFDNLYETYSTMVENVEILKKYDSPPEVPHVTKEILNEYNKLNENS